MEEPRKTKKYTNQELMNSEYEAGSLNTRQRQFNIVVFIIIILGISFMQGIYTSIPETNHVPREHCVATILK